MIKKIVTSNRISVLLGANGSGKSTMLKKFAKSHETTKDLLYIQGGRTISFPGRLDQILQMDDYSTVENNITRNLTKNINQRLNNLLGILYKDSKDQELRSYREAKAKKLTNMEYIETPIDKLIKLFCEIFPWIKLEVSEKDEEIIAIQGDSNKYKISELSDGEKQCLAMLCDVLNQKLNIKYVIVDEPELNLHPKLAVKLWETIESFLPKTIFVYATHNIMFALRPDVNSITILSKKHEPKTLNKEEIYSYDDFDDFLGTLPGILTYDKVILCEGEDTSKFDEYFYKWVTKDETIGVFSVKNCSSVINTALSFTTLKEIIGPTVKILGIIDGDGKDKETENYIRLQFDESESYLCHPEILCSVSAKELDELSSIVQDSIINIFESIKYKILSREVTRKTIKHFNISIPRKELVKIKSDEMLVLELEKQKSSQLAWITDNLDQEKIKQIISDLNSNIENLRNQINISNIEKCLEFIPGKELLNEILKNIDIVKNKEDYIRILIEKNITIDLASINNLKEKINYKFNTV